jgi:hypothetical protein
MRSDETHQSKKALSFLSSSSSVFFCACSHFLSDPGWRRFGFSGSGQTQEHALARLAVEGEVLLVCVHLSRQQLRRRITQQEGHTRGGQTVKRPKKFNHKIFVKQKMPNCSNIKQC